MVLVHHPDVRRSRPDAPPTPPAPPSPYLRAYRHLLPARVRSRLRDRMTPEVWERLKFHVERPALLARRIRDTVDGSLLRHRGKLAARTHRPVTADGRTRVALVRNDLDPLAAREWNLQAVCSALRSAGVEHFAVRGLSDTRSVVGLSADDRTAAVGALHSMAVRLRCYVSLPKATARTRTARPADHPKVWEEAAHGPVFRVFCYQSDHRSGEVYGAGYGCDVELWQPDGDRLLAPRRNRCCDSVDGQGPAGVIVPGRLFTRLAPAQTPESEAQSETRAPVAPTSVPGTHPVPGSDADADTGTGTDTDPRSRTGLHPRAGVPACAARPPLLPVRSRPEFIAPLPDDIRFPVDAVYTWVDGDDPAWRERRAKASGTVGSPYHAESANDARYASHDELRYSLRSLHRHAPWVRHVYLVTDRQLPTWLNTAEPRLTVVDHSDLFTDRTLLPTFNSHAIESQLHHIDGLSEHFLYFNDDVFLGRPLTPQRFFLANGTTRFFPSKAQLPCGPPDETDVPVSAAGKNNRRLLAARFGSSIVQKMQHTPSALRRSVLYEIEREFPEEHRRTAASRFRGLGDLAIANSLHHYYAFHTGRAVPGSLRYDYVDTSSADVARRLHRLLATRSCHAFCINDTVCCDPETGQSMGRFLESYFPCPSPFEIADTWARAPQNRLNTPQRPATSGEPTQNPAPTPEADPETAPETDPTAPAPLPAHPYPASKSVTA